jgi:hypothetical protein
MTNHKKINLYLPEEFYQTLIAYQEQQEFDSASDAVVEILAQFFQKGNEAKRYATVEQLEALEGKVTRLTFQVAALSQVRASSTPSEAARTEPAFGNDYIHPANLAQPPSVDFENTSVEEVEDEPDEILLDFLEPGSRS